MDYISDKLNEKIKLAKAQSNVKDIIQYSSVLIQYYLFICLSILFNSDWEVKGGMPIERKALHRPSLGTILEICRILNNSINVFKKWKEIDKVFSAYIQLRNNSGQGHGFDFSHDNEKQLDEYSVIIKQLEKLEPLLSKKYNIIQIQKINEDIFTGVNYSSNGKIYPWSHHNDQKQQFNKDEVYLQTQGGFFSGLTSGNFFENIYVYSKISPFLKIDKDEFWLFQSINEPLTGTIKYNNLFRTSQIAIEYPPFKNFGLVSTDEFQMRQISINGSIRNNYEVNYKDFISIYENDSFINEVIDFLKSKSSSIATIWGHGGVGKTATLQNICEKLFLGSRKELEKKNLYFNYIIFLSAKDRKYNYATGQIENIAGEKLTDYNGLIEKINELVFNENSYDEDKIIDEFLGKALIIIDDFETLNVNERKKIIEFSDKLDINRHKIIISSRLTTGTGKEIERKELNEDETIRFLKGVLDNQFTSLKDSYDFEENEINHNIYKITSGRPLFIFHFAYLFMQNQNINEISTIDIKNTKAASEFIYGRLYSYLDENCRIIYKTLGYIVSKNDLLCRVGNLQYLTEMENSSFQNCINILEKLRIISLSEGRDFMSICSSEILVNMEHLLKEDNLLNAKIVNRLSSDNFIVMGSSKSIFQQKFEGIKIKAKIQKDGSKIVDEYEMLIRDQTFSHEEHLLVFEDLINYLINKNIDYVLALNMCNEFSLYFKNDSRFQVKYFETLKDSGKISEAISLAKNYIETIEEVSFANCDYFVLAGKYLELICKSLINSKDDLIDKQSELSSEEYSKMTYNLRIEMISLAEQSKSIFLNLVKISFGNLTRKQKIVVSGGFLQLIKMIRRILKDKNNLIAERYELFSEICNYGINHFSPEIRDQLIKIKFQVDNNDLEEIIKDKKKGDSNKKLTDFGEKLLQALNKNKKV